MVALRRALCLPHLPFENARLTIQPPPQTPRFACFGSRACRYLAIQGIGEVFADDFYLAQTFNN